MTTGLNISGQNEVITPAKPRAVTKARTAIENTLQTRQITPQTEWIIFILNLLVA